MSDTFLQQIQNAELTAQKMIHDAEAKNAKDLEHEERRLSQQREKNIEIAREAAKKKIAEKQNEMKKLYQEHIQKEEKDLAQQKKQIQEKEDKVLQSTYTYFLNDLLS